MNARHEFDFIIIGAGSAGCVLAASLSRDPNVRDIDGDTSLSSLGAARRGRHDRRKIGYSAALCGACTVLIDGPATQSQLSGPGPGHTSIPAGNVIRHILTAIIAVPAIILATPVLAQDPAGISRRPRPEILDSAEDNAAVALRVLSFN